MNIENNMYSGSKDMSDPKSNFSSQNPVQMKNKLEGNGLIMNLIDRKQITYEDFGRALEITKDQINGLLKFNHKNEADSLDFLKNQLGTMNSLLKTLTDFKAIIIEEREKVIKSLQVFIEFEIKYRNKNTTVEEEIKLLTIDSKELEQIHETLNEKIKEKVSFLENYIKGIDQTTFNQAKIYLEKNDILFWQTQEIFIGILMQKEKSSTQEIQQVYSSYEYFMKMITNKSYETLPPILIGNLLKNIQEIEVKTKESKGDQFELILIIERFINIIKTFCELANYYHNLNQNSSHFASLKSEDISGKNKNTLFAESKLLANQIITFNSIIHTLDANIDRKNKEISQVNDLIISLPNLYRNGLQVSVSESVKQELYSQEEIIPEVDIANP